MPRSALATSPRRCALEADGVVIGEPGGIEEDFDRLHLVSRGIARMRLVARADQGHSSLADELGFRNAGVDAARAVVAVRDELEPEAPPNEHRLSGWHATVNTGLAYRGGVGYGVLPAASRSTPRSGCCPAWSAPRWRASSSARCAPSPGAPAPRSSSPSTSRRTTGCPRRSSSREHPLAADAERGLRDGARPACRRAGGVPGHDGRDLVRRAAGQPTLPALGPGAAAPRPRRRRVGVDRRGCTAPSSSTPSSPRGSAARRQPA